MREEKIATIKPKSNALHHELTRKPGTRSEVHIMIRTLMTSKNRPNVKMVIGMVSITRIGLTTAFNKPSTSATKIAVHELLTETPLSIHEANKTATAVINILRIMRCMQQALYSLRVVGFTLLPIHKTLRVPGI